MHFRTEITASLSMYFMPSTAASAPAMVVKMVTQFNKVLVRMARESAMAFQRWRCGALRVPQAVRGFGERGEVSNVAKRIGHDAQQTVPRPRPWLKRCQQGSRT